jgi:hypothetical protein
MISARASVNGPRERSTDAIPPSDRIVQPVPLRRMRRATSGTNAQSRAVDV